MLDVDKARTRLDYYLRKKEGEKLSPYRCIAGIPTIGVGATSYPDGRKVQMSDPAITLEQSAAMLNKEIDRYCDAVLEMINHSCTTMQLVALVMCGYNIGLAGLRGSSIIRAHNAGDFSAAANSFRLWNKYRNPQTGKLEESSALLARRVQESAIYLSDTAGLKATPQAVGPESNLARSPIMQSAAGAATVGAAVISNAPTMPSPAKIEETLTTVSTISTQATGVAASFGVNLWVLAGIALVIFGAVAAYQRWNQRHKGFA